MLKVLIVDDEDDILDINTFCVEDVFSIAHEITVAKSGNEAISKLSNGDFDICICDHNMPNGTGVDVCEYIFSKKLKTKHVLCSSVLPSEFPNTYNNEKLFFNIVKPDITNGIEKLFVKIRPMIESNIVTSPSPEKFVPISVKLLFLICELPCDVYLKINDEKFIKTFNRKDFFKTEDLEKYKAKDIVFFYIKSDGTDKALLGAISRATEKLLTTIEQTPEERLLNTHQYVTEVLKNFGLSEDVCNIAKDSIKQSLNEILRNDISFSIYKRISLMGELPSQLYVMQATLCGILTKKISWCSEATLHKQIVAAFFQDVTLNSSKLMLIYDYEHFLKIKETLSGPEIENYLNHPINSREMVLKIKSLPADVDKIILEQHEMPNGNGFPRKLNNKNISPICAMFILTGYISKKLILEREIDIQKELENLELKGYSKGNFKETYRELKMLF